MFSFLLCSSSSKKKNNQGANKEIGKKSVIETRQCFSKAINSSPKKLR